MDLLVAATVFVIIFPAELPDKTALASLVLGTRYRPLYVFVGAAAAFAVHAALAVAAGSVLGLLPHRPLEIIVAALFLLGAILLLRARPDEAEAEAEAEQLEIKERRNRFWPVAGTGFVMILVAEFGDLTQIVTANLAAKYDDPLAVGIGATLALWAVAGLAIVGGRGLLKVVSLTLVSRVAAAIMLVMAAVSLIGAFT